MAIEIVDFPIKNGDVPWQNVSSPEGNHDIPIGYYHILPYLRTSIWDGYEVGQK